MVFQSNYAAHQFHPPVTHGLYYQEEHSRSTEADEISTPNIQRIEVVIAKILEQSSTIHIAKQLAPNERVNH